MDMLIHAAWELLKRARDRSYCARLRRQCCASTGAEFQATAQIHNPWDARNIKIGQGSLICGELLLNRESAKITIGEWCFIGTGAKLWAIDRIAIGDHVFISHGVHILDNNSHSVELDDRAAAFLELRRTGTIAAEPIDRAPVTIEDHAWIGFNAAILKGVTVGRGAIVGAGAFVTHDVAPMTTVVGNPARQVPIDGRTQMEWWT